MMLMAERMIFDERILVRSLGSDTEVHGDEAIPRNSFCLLRISTEAGFRSRGGRKTRGKAARLLSRAEITWQGALLPEMKNLTASLHMAMSYQKM